MHSAGRAILACVLAAAFRLAPLHAAQAQGAAPAASCVTAGEQAEREFGLPAGLLLAIGRIESGHFDPSTSMTAPWPWIIDAGGQDMIFATKAEAVVQTQATVAGGIRSIDVGCFQVNLLYHPHAFADLDEAFDPVANARYAAQFLAALHQRTGLWQAAVALYHSATPALGEPYRDRVLASWGVLAQASADFRSPSGIEHSDPFTILASPASRAVRVWRPRSVAGITPRSPIMRASVLPRVITP